MPSVSLTKHHGLGTTSWCSSGPTASPGRGPGPRSPNVTIVASGSVLTVSCSPRRRTMTSARPSEPILVMRLYNSDGSTAQMSGNGIRCLVQAGPALGVERGAVVVVTDAGPAGSSSPRPEPATMVARSTWAGRADRAPAGWLDVAAHEHRPWLTSAWATPHGRRRRGRGRSRPPYRRPARARRQPGDRGAWT